MTPDIIIMGFCLLILIVGQSYKLWKADKEYKEERERFYKRMKQLK